MKTENWNTEKIPELNGKVIIVTGSTSGIGKEAARVIAGKNAKLIMAVRDMEKGKAAAEEIRKAFSGADVEVRKLDLASIESIKSFAESFSSDFDRLDILINNAGIMMPPYSKTADGFEIQMGTNHIGHFALSGLLMPVLKHTEGSKIVVLSSGLHARGEIDFNDMNWENRKYNTQQAYADSKIANLYFAYELARRLEVSGNNPKVTAAHPGWTATELQRHSKAMNFMNKIFAQKVEMGVLPTLRAAFDINAKPGDYFGPNGKMHLKGFPEIQKSNDLSYDKEIAKRLWKMSEELTGITF